MKPEAWAALKALQRAPWAPVDVADPKPIKRRVKPDPVRLRARGPIDSNDYRAMREAQRKRTYVQYQGRLYRVERLTRDAAAGTFEALLMERRGR